MITAVFINGNEELAMKTDDSRVHWSVSDAGKGWINSSRRVAATLFCMLAVMIVVHAQPGMAAERYRGLLVVDKEGGYRVDESQYVTFAMEDDAVSDLLIHIDGVNKDVSFSTCAPLQADGSNFTQWFAVECRKMTAYDQGQFSYDYFMAGAYAGISPVITPDYSMHKQIKAVSDQIGREVPARTFVIYANKKPVYEFFCYPDVDKLSFGEKADGHPLLVISEGQPKSRWEEKLQVDHSLPMNLSYLIDSRQFYLNQILLVYGFRQENGKAGNAVTVWGSKTGDQDWLLERESTAIWVTGVNAPGHHGEIILRARLEEKEGEIMLRGYQVIEVGPDREPGVTLKTGEYLYYDLPGSRSNSCPIELIGDAVETVFYDPHSGVIVEAVKPGAAKLKVFSHWWQDAQAKYLREYDIVVSNHP